ncbi:MAG: hypothetical protein FJX77_16830 [Armatimonadetes bacterium]|nr:hypothetical protein [Armatimonadota bacterium]
MPLAGLALAADGSLLPLPADVTCVTEVKIVPENATVVAGTSQEFDVIARSFHDGKWYKVTERKELTLSLEGDAQTLMKVSGTPATFAVPMGMAQGLAGKAFRLRASFTLPNQDPITAETEVLVRAAPSN